MTKSASQRKRRATIGLRLLMRVNSQRKLRKLKREVRWEGDLGAMRRD